MVQKKKKEPTIISFLSGKGGSGKTMASLAIAKILANMGFKVLVIDFDLSTNGASYFFSPKLSRKRIKGIVETLHDYALENVRTLEYEMSKVSVINVGDNFDFIPSRSKFGTSLFLNQEINKKEIFIKKILRPMIYEIGRDYDYVLIDNQAGYSNAGAAATNVSSKVVIVAEADRISSDAVDNLIALIGNDMPQFRRYLINKVEIKEAGEYHSKVKIFKAMNRLPPLPFDFDVKNLFGDRRIPINLDKPTPFLIAMFATLKEIVPEKRDLFEKYENEKVTVLFDKYQNKLEDLLKKREKLKKNRLFYQTYKDREESQRRMFSSYIQAMISIMITILLVVNIVAFNILSMNIATLINIFGIMIVIYAIIISWILRRRTYKIKRSEKLMREQKLKQILITQQLTDIEKEVDRYKNLITTQSKELLIDYISLTNDQKNADYSYMLDDVEIN